MQFGLKEFLLFVSLASVALCGMAMGGVASAVAESLIWMLFAISLITAAVARGLLQSRAIGFIIPVCIYALPLFVLAENEFDPYGGKMPTTQISKHAFELMAHREWINQLTGERMPADFDPYANNNPSFYVKESLSRLEFMRSAHVLWALLFGFVGAQLAVWLHKATRSTEARERAA